jgi:3-dehydroquinate dehydratase-2
LEVFFVAKILVLHGPNLNLLGQREPDQYGRQTLADIDAELAAFAAQCQLSIESFQSNAEHELVERVHRALAEAVDYIIINPAAFTHTSVALRDALLAVAIPFIEVHLSRVAAREPFRQVSYFSDIALGVISGFGADSYVLALQALINRIDEHDHGHP